jgi:hypothetical protein
MIILRIDVKLADEGSAHTFRVFKPRFINMTDRKDGNFNGLNRLLKPNVALGVKRRQAIIENRESGVFVD